MRPSDDDLTELLSLQMRIKFMQKRVDEIKDMCRKEGSFFTAKYTVSIIKRTRVGLAGLNEVKEFIHEDILNQYGLIRSSTYELVEVGIIPSIKTI